MTRLAVESAMSSKFEQMRSSGRSVDAKQTNAHVVRA